ncbi:hypothetical protein K5X82_01085 [Halosquirtibacter xylanolyticus]|uniref:thiamine pyrophosphate-binding protein n=1 Tax=Halosquirtibacter xylanolyticus TaxID=3374599 RepID=UPI00374964D7|nr:hypothetical protein K5X82_01085 [Prolixibacteraceae bacterium]
MKISISDFLLRRLKEVNVNYLFGIPGDYVLPFFDVLLDGDHGVKHIGVTNELNGAYNADGYSKINGFGAVAVTHGPGALNTTNAVAGAYADDIPLIVIAGSPKTEVFNTPSDKLYHHVLGTDLDATLRLFDQITIKSKRLMRSEDAITMIDDLIRTSLCYKKPVYIELPYDLQSKEIEWDGNPINLMQGQSNKLNLVACLKQLSVMLTKSKTRNALVGHLVQREYLEKDVLSLIEEIGATVATSFVGKNGSFERLDCSVGFYMGAMSTELCLNHVEKSDLTLKIGVTNNEFDTGIFSGNIKNGVDFLQSKVIIGDKTYENVFLRDIIPALVKQEKHNIYDFPLIKEEKRFYYDVCEKVVPTDDPITIDRLMLMFAHYFDKGDVFFGEVGGYINCSQIGFPPNTIIQGNGNWASLGSGFGTLVGATFADIKNRRVIGVLGDGGFQMTAQEMSTLIAHDKNIVLYVLNNKGYAAERAIHKDVYRSYNDIQVWNYHLLPIAFGAHENNAKGFEVYTENEMKTVLNLMKKPKGLNVVNIHLDPNDLASFNVAFSEKLRH